MFAISAMSVQNVNAQNENEKVNPAAKQEVGKVDTKKVEQDQPKALNQSVNDPKKKDNSQVDDQQQGAPIHKIQGKKGAIQKNNDPIKNDAQSEQNKIDENQQQGAPVHKMEGKKGAIKKSDKPIKNDAQSQEVNANDKKATGHGAANLKAKSKKAAIQKDIKPIKNDAQAEQKEENNQPKVGGETPNNNLQVKPNEKPLERGAQKGGQKNDAKAEQKEANNVPSMRTAQPSQTNNVESIKKTEKPVYKDKKQLKSKNNEQGENVIKPKTKSEAQTSGKDGGKDVK